MSDLEKRFSAPKVSLNTIGKKVEKKKPLIAANNESRSVDDPMDAIAEEHIEGWTTPLEKKPARKTRTKREKKPTTTNEKTEWPDALKGTAENATYSVGPKSKTETRLNREIDRDFEKEFQKELKKIDPELDPSIHEAFEDELKRATEEDRAAKWSNEVAELTAEVKRTAEEPAHGTNPTKVDQFDLDEALPVLRDQDKALDELVKKYATPKKKGFLARLFSWWG